MSIRCLNLLFLYLFTIQSLNGQSFNFSKIDANSGLSHNNVKAILQDDLGFIWLGTRNGLNRFDGNRIKRYDCFDKQIPLRDNNISALFQDKYGEIWIGTDKGIFIHNPVKETFRFFNLKTENGKSIKDWISTIQMDSNQNIWIVSPQEGVFRYAVKQNKLFHYTVVSHLKPSELTPQCLTIDKEGKIWVGTNGEGVYTYHTKLDKFEQRLGDRDGNKYLIGKNIFAIASRDNYLILGLHEHSLIKLNKRTNTLKLMDNKEIHSPIIRDVKVLDEHIWIATDNGLIKIDEKSNTIRYAREDLTNSNSLSNRNVETIYQDRMGTIWIGTKFGGVNFLPKSTIAFENYTLNNDPSQVARSHARALKEDLQGNIWIGTEETGAYVFKPGNRSLDKINHLSFPKTLGLWNNGQNIWVGFYKNGIDKINTKTGHKEYLSMLDLGIEEGSVSALCVDNSGKVWLGNAWGVYLAENSTGKFKRQKHFGLSYVQEIMQDRTGLIWVATLGNGIFMYNPKDDSTKHFTQGSTKSISSNSVSSILEDHLGQIWFSTDRGGIMRYSKSKNEFTTFDKADGLPDDIVYKIVEDDECQLWFGTNRGLVRFNPQSKAIRIFTKADGLLSDQFNYNSALKSTSNKLYFGNMNGLLAFDPNSIKVDTLVPPIYITALLVNQHEISAIDKNSLLTKNITYTKQIELKHTQSNIELQFTALHFSAEGYKKYAYKLDGLDNEWIHTTRNTVSYNQLPAGKYTFMIKFMNKDGFWSKHPTILHITILPPWWLSIYAKIGYILILIALLYIFYTNKIRGIHAKSLTRQKQFELDKEKELYEARLNFFTEIAHEIRTPVSLITGPLETIIDHKNIDPSLKQKLQAIDKNAQYLTNLINQLLDFRKIDNKHFKLNYTQIPIISLITQLKSRYEHIIQEQGKSLSLNFNISQEKIQADQDALIKIIDNLLSNAVKYSHKQIEIDITLEKIYLTVQIANDGPLIEKKYYSQIFDPFFQINHNNIGSGIGLSLARSLAELHAGYLTFDTLKGLNVFTLKLPVNLLPEKEASINSNTHELLTIKNNLPTVLIVEDNSEMLQFIHEILVEDYTILKASNGQEALDFLESGHRIDLILSDLMMPKIDGLELCNKLKSSQDHSTIIFVLLTAKHDVNTKIKSLQLGADAYVEKPFSPLYLKTLLSSLLLNRKKDLELLSKKPFINYTDQTISKGDEEFMNLLVHHIQDNLSDKALSVDQLADMMFISKSTLSRKTKSITNMSPLDLIRIVRLQKAAEFIQEGRLQINEISNKVGFNTPSYFAKLFQAHFGLTPKAFEKQFRQ